MKKGDKTVMTVRATVSPDGKTRGQDVNNASGSSNFTGPRVALRFCGKLSACQRNEQNPIKHSDRPINSKRRLPAVQHRIRERNRPARMSMRRFTRLTNGFRASSWRTRPRGCAALFPLQLLPRSPDAASHARDGSGFGRSHLDTGGTVQSPTSVAFAVTAHRQETATESSGRIGY
jgi:hypothetical protein